MNQLSRTGIIAWFAGNSVASNLLLISIILLGLLSIDNLRKEAFPPWPVDSVTVSVTYDSGDASQTEEGIALKVEEAVASLSGIKRVTSVSDANTSTVTIEGVSGYDLDILLRDVKSKVDAIYNFPADAENPVIEKQALKEHAYSVKIYGDTDRQTLQTLAERIKIDLLAQSQISNVDIKGKAEKLLSVEIDEAKLESYGLTLSDVQTAINAESSSALSTSLRSEDQIVRLKVARQAYYAEQFAQIPVITDPSGTVIRLGDISRIEDGFTDQTYTLARYNGMNGIGLEMTVNETGDVIKLVEEADKVIKKWQTSAALPDNVSVVTWNDGSTLIKDRLSLLIKNALSGIALVFVVLALFLNLRVALWVVAGLPFIFCGTLFFMSEPFTGMSINEMTTFGFILALGIVVDDAVVVGESIYTERRIKGDTLANTIAGTKRVAVPTIFGVLTTVAVFVALANIEGGMGQVYSQFAVIVTICLLLSVVESKLILPAHLANLNTHRKIGSGWKDCWARIQHRCDAGLMWVTEKLYAPLIRQVIQFRYAAVLAAIAIFTFVLAMPFNGSVRIGFFPDIPGATISAGLTMQNDASFGLTRKNLLILEHLALKADQNLSGPDNTSAIGTVEIIASGDFSGSVTVELNDSATYSINEFTREWKSLTGSLEGVKSLDIRSGFGGGNEFKVELKAWDSQTLALAGEEFLTALSQINGVQGIDNNFSSGQNQLKFSLTQQGYALGVTTADLSRQVLQAFGGEVVQQYQRGKDEIKVRIRYPESARRDVSDILNAKVRLPDGSVVPLQIVASVTEEYQQTERTRIGGLQAYYVSASVDKTILSPTELVQQLQETLVPTLLQRYPDLDIHFAGEAEEQAETAGSMIELFIIAMMAVYILLAVPLRSYFQPLIIMTAIPFGLVGAILGHWFNDMMLSVLSFNGIVALSGVVVNDSLLLVSRFNENRKQDIPYREAIIEACTGRIRPVLLTSLTTFAGLAPLLSETSTQAQFIIPAAASLGYGILFATVITLIIIPAMLMIQYDVKMLFSSQTNVSETNAYPEDSGC
ncbi:efflux RND transporter permease subunit [Aliamphritea spongicola]|uniref:efflux RND transporter permease subunit n=1 Tax=Aliamphritea spongicola TaxID=707589 RepID=UPI00196B8F08|nr:efflux RND transporter permease subunit [Aliamphritea spongicola]MBN3561576.1 efflux RND transporter permease subunit [Aliamphritea spongicola]